MIPICFHQVIINSLTLVDLKPEMYRQLLSVAAGIVSLVFIFCSVNVLNSCIMECLKTYLQRGDRSVNARRCGKCWCCEQ